MRATSEGGGAKRTGDRKVKTQLVGENRTKFMSKGAGIEESVVLYEIFGQSHAHGSIPYQQHPPAPCLITIYKVLLKVRIILGCSLLLDHCMSCASCMRCVMLLLYSFVGGATAGITFALS